MDSPSTIVPFIGLDPRAFFAPLPVPPSAVEQTVALWAGLGRDDVLAQRDAIRRAVSSAVDDLLADPGIARAAAALPFRGGERVVVLGDSISAEAGSWADLLAEVLRRVRPGATLLNWSLAGRTTAETVAALAPVVAERPDWVVTMIGTNDVRRHGVRGGVRMASTAGVADARSALRQRLRDETSARIVTLTPPPIDPAPVEANRAPGIWWEPSDIADAVSAALADDPAAIDVNAGVVTHPGFWVADGIHPAPSGQREILRVVLAGLAQRGSSADERAVRSTADR